MSTLSVDEELALLLAELERANGGSVDFDWSEEFDFPSFVTTTNGQQCHFTRSALSSLHRLARLLHKSRSPSATRIELPEFTKLDRPAFRRHPVAIIDGNDRGVYGQQQAVHG